MSKVRMTHEEWLDKGKQLFGDDVTKWEFVCPGCGHVQKPEDFRRYADRGATPNSATCECIGRYMGSEYDWFEKTCPCNYVAYGLFHVSPVIVVDDGQEVQCFGFNEPQQEGDSAQVTIPEHIARLSRLHWKELQRVRHESTCAACGRSPEPGEPGWRRYRGPAVGTHYLCPEHWQALQKME